MTKFYEKTGMYIDWDQLDKLPDIDVFVDIGVGPKGTPAFWQKYSDKKLICIDPLPEAVDIASDLLKGADYKFINCALGSERKEQILNVEGNKGRSSFLEPTSINIESAEIEKVSVDVETLDNVISDEILDKRIGIKIDTEGYELEVLKGASKTLKSTSYIIAEVRHNHKSFENQYSFSEFNLYLYERGFVPSIVFTAKPFILDIAYMPF